jgi:hypothetical protein
MSVDYKKFMMHERTAGSSGAGMKVNSFGYLVRTCKQGAQLRDTRKMTRCAAAI